MSQTLYIRVLRVLPKYVENLLKTSDSAHPYGKMAYYNKTDQLEPIQEKKKAS